MAHRYLVKNGFQLETIDVEAGVFTPAREGPTRAVTLDSVVKVLGDILTGANDAARLVTLKGIWSTMGITDIAQSATRGYMSSTSGVLNNTVNDRNNALSGQSIHQTSYKNVLPPRFSEAWDALTTSNSNTNLAIEKNRAVIKLLEGSFENIKSHGTEAEAWSAYNDFIIRGQDDEVDSNSRTNYLVNPSKS